MAGTFTVDDSGQRALFEHYGQAKLDRIFQQSARAGARAAEPIVQAAAPIGTSKREGQYYRREGLGHGTLRGTVKARRIRKRGINKQTIGFVIGPAGRNVSSHRGFVRVWVVGGTRPHLIRRGRGGRVQHPGQQANPWVRRVNDRAVAAARVASDAVIVRYASKITGAR